MYRHNHLSLRVLLGIPYLTKDILLLILQHLLTCPVANLLQPATSTMMNPFFVHGPSTRTPSHDLHIRPLHYLRDHLRQTLSRRLRKNYKQNTLTLALKNQVMEVTIREHFALVLLICAANPNNLISNMALGHEDWDLSLASTLAKGIFGHCWELSFELEMWLSGVCNNLVWRRRW